MSTKGYDGFNRTAIGGGGNVVVAGRRREAREQQQTAPPATPQQQSYATVQMVVPYEDADSRLTYLKAVKDYLTTQLAIVEAQLDSEMENV